MESGPSFSARAESRHRVANIALCGEFDTAAVSLFAAQVTPFEGNGGRSSILDLHDLTFLHSPGVHALFRPELTPRRTVSSSASWAHMAFRGGSSS
jgi:hypothetical protein